MSLLIKLLKSHKQFLYLFLILFLGLILRLYLTPLGFHVDIFSNAGWGRWIWQNGSLGFYEHSIWTWSWPTQPPLVSLLYGLSYNLYELLLQSFVNIGNFIALNRIIPTKFIWFFDFTIWFDDAVTKEIDFPIGYLISIKLFPILADILIAIIVYFFAVKAKAKQKLIWPALFLFSPFSFYLSSLWGQYDQIGFLFLILSLLSLTKNKLFIISPMLLALSISLKPTSLIFVPIYLYFVYLKKPSLKQLALSGVLAGLVAIKSIQVFAGDTNWFLYIKDTLFRLIFLKSEPRVSTNALNFWHIIIGNKAVNHNDLFLLLPYKYWGYLSALILNFWVIKNIKKVNFKNIALALFTIGLGSWIFMTGMMDRYAFTGLIGGLLLSIYNPKILKYWFLLSFVYTINLYKGWWFPEQIIFLKDILEINEGMVGRVLSIINVITFLIIFKKIYKNK